MNVGAYPCTRADVHAEGVRRSGDDPVVTAHFELNKVIHDQVLQELSNAGLRTEQAVDLFVQHFVHKDVWLNADGQREYKALDVAIIKEPKRWMHRTTGSACMFASWPGVQGNA